MASVPLLEIRDLHVSTVESGTEPAAEILHGISLTVQAGEIHAVVDSTGSVASALARVMLGPVDHRVTGGRILFRGDDITDWPTHLRARAGLFLAFGDPAEIPGVSILHLVSRAARARSGPDTKLSELRQALVDWMGELEIDPALIERSVNRGPSAEENRRSELVQLAVLQPEMAIVDMTAAGLGRDGTAPGSKSDDLGPAIMGDRGIAAGLRTVRTHRPALGTLAMTHDQRLLEDLQPDLVHVLVDGRIASSGTWESARRLETHGHGNFT